MALHNLQVTIGAAPTQFSATRTVCQEVTVQNNAGAVMRVGDSTTTAAIGISLTNGGAANSIWKFGPYYGQPINLQELYVMGTQGQILDVAYVLI